jgi:hypothetical protein
MIPAQVQTQLEAASVAVRRQAHGRRRASKAFSSAICGDEWDGFIEQWAPVCYAFVAEALGPYATEPASQVLALSDASHSAGANASFELGSGQVRLSPSIVRGKPGITLEKLTHEFTHGALAAFPEGDMFYEEGFCDYSVWVMAHAPIWGMHRQDMIDAAAFNIACRRDRAMRDLSDYDRKRWAGGVFCSAMHGPWIIAKLKMRKLEGTLYW